MADAEQLKERVRAYRAQMVTEREKAALTYAAELRRMDAQIIAAERVLAAWDNRVDLLIGLLIEAGISVNV